MRESLEYADLSPERIERLMQAARIERAQAVRAALVSVFRGLRGLSDAKPARQPEACPAPC